MKKTKVHPEDRNPHYFWSLIHEFADPITLHVQEERLPNGIRPEYYKPTGKREGGLAEPFHTIYVDRFAQLATKERDLFS
jgi:hypothetical protein